jgi:hypothetical protein
MRIEKLLKARGVACKMIPVPRQISSDCGVCIRITSAQAEAVRETIEKARLEIQGIADI